MQRALSDIHTHSWLGIAAMFEALSITLALTI